MTLFAPEATTYCTVHTHGQLPDLPVGTGYGLLRCGDTLTLFFGDVPEARAWAKKMLSDLAHVPRPRSSEETR